MENYDLSSVLGFIVFVALVGAGYYYLTKKKDK